MLSENNHWTIVEIVIQLVRCTVAHIQNAMEERKTRDTNYRANSSIGRQRAKNPRKTCGILGLQIPTEQRLIYQKNGRFRSR